MSAATTNGIDPADWGARLRRRRQRAKLTQGQLAALLTQQNPGLRIDQSRVSLWETGARKPTDDQRVAIAYALDVRPQTLFPYPPRKRAGAA